MKQQHPRPTDPVDLPLFWEPSLAFLKYAIGFVLAGSAVYVLAIVALVPDQLWRVAGPVALALVAATARFLLARGRRVATVHVLAIGTWSVVTGIVFYSGGVSGAITIVYPVIILMTGWMLGTRAAVAFASITVAATFGFVLAELPGLLPPPPPAPPVMRWIIQSFVIAFAAVLIAYFVRAYQNRLKDAGALGSELALRSAEVQAREAELNRAQAVARVGSWVYDLAADAIRLSAETCRIFDLPEGTGGGYDAYLARVHPQDRDAVARAWRAALEGGEAFDSEHRILAGAAVRWVRQKAELELGAGGRPLRAVGTTQDITERKRHEAEAAAARSQLDATLDAIPDLLFEVGLDGRFHDYHSPHSEFLLAPPEEFLGRTIDEILPPDAAAAAMSALREAHETGSSDGRQYEIDLPQGRRCFELSVSRKPVAPGQAPRFIALSRDITGRKQAEEELRKRNAFVETLLEHAPIGFAVNTMHDGRPVFVGRNFEKIYGLAPGSIDSTADFFEKVYADPVQREEMRARIMADIASGDAARMRWENISIRTQAGEDKVVTAINIPRPEQDLMISTVQDLTESKRREGEYRTVIQASTDGFWVTDSAGRILDANDSICRMLGYTREELLGMAIRDIDADETPAEVARRTSELMQAGGAQFQARHRRKDGRVIDVEVSVQYVAALGARLFAFVRDISGRKQAEARQGELEAQLRESQKMEALGTLAGGVAHDFNNIVATIMGNAELALQDVGPGHAAQESLEEIRKASRRAKDMVQQILAFGRRQVLERKVIGLAAVVEDSMRLLRSTLPAGVGLRVECAPDAPAVLADATQVQQVLLNLCGNAWQAMQGQSRPPEIEVRLEACEHGAGSAAGVPAAHLRGELRPGRYARLSVRDNGPGMDEATLARIFEPFFTTKPVGEGTGLGLAVVHGILQEHGAAIEVGSVPGAGSAFRVYFPACEGPAVAVERAPAEARAAGAQPDRSGKSIVYVDDDEAIVFLMTRLLERQGYRVRGYTDPQAALAAVRAQPKACDLVVTDYNMPGMSGLELARALRAIRPGLPVALASGYITEELRTQAPLAGVSELIYKPNTAGELCEVVARLAHALPG
jgi:PAS domain S-box-containing protein